MNEIALADGSQFPPGEESGERKGAADFLDETGIMVGLREQS